jgi:TonB family protein
MKTFLILLLFSFTCLAQEDEPNYKFKLGTVEYNMYNTQNSGNDKYDTLYYNLYRVGTPKRIAKEISQIINQKTGDVVAESYYNVGDGKIVFYYTSKGKATMEHVYTQNKKGLLTYKSAENKIPPPEQVRVNFYNEQKYEDVMVPTVALTTYTDQVDEIAEYPGGIDKLRQFLGANIKYPSEAIENNVDGKVILSFIVEKDGAISNIKVTKSLGFGCDEEVIRVLKLSAKWTPAQLNGEPVRYTYNLPVQFTAVD